MPAVELCNPGIIWMQVARLSHDEIAIRKAILAYGGALEIFIPGKLFGIDNNRVSLLAFEHSRGIHYSIGAVS